MSWLDPAYSSKLICVYQFNTYFMKHIHYSKQSHTTCTCIHTFVSPSYAALEQGKMVDPAFREESYAFCTLEGVGACSVLIFNPYGRKGCACLYN